ncbi:RNA polymerase II assembly factor like protein [Tanacetum coccineum]
MNLVDWKVFTSLMLWARRATVYAVSVVESRTQLIFELGELDVSDENGRASILECLAPFWEDFTCLDVSQCMLNKTILQVASNYLESDISKCLSQLLALGTKGSIWCRKHMKMTLMSTDDSQEEEHYGLFFQVLLDMLSHSAAVLSALARHPVSTGKELMSAVETFILELLNLTKDSILEAKRIQTHGSEVLKASQVILDAVICLCKAYCNNTKTDDNGRTEKDVQSSVKESDDVNHVISVAKCTIENLVELGILAANAGGNLVTVLNLSWKGVVTLLQLGKGLLSTWSSLIEPVSAAEAKRIFIPVKFYLINAARIISHYPSQAFLIFKDITLCILTVLTFRIFLGKDELLNSASVTLAELLEPTSVHLLNSLLNSAQLGHKHKCQILDWLFSDITTSSFVPKDDKSMDAIFSLTCKSMHESKLLLLGHVALFVNLLLSAPDLEDDVKLEIAKKLEWLLNILIDEDVYSSIIALPLPLLHGSGNQNMFSSVINAMKTFMLVASSTLVWGEVESFLLENFFHPHHLCWGIIMELWCFLVRHAESDMGNAIIDQLCTLMKTTVSWESVLDSGSVLRKLARSISMLVKHGSNLMTDRVFNFITNSNASKLSSAMYIALLLEGFPLNGLSDKVRSVAKQRLLTEYFNFVDVFDNDSSRERANVMFGAPVFALSAALQSLQVSISDTEMKTIKLLSTIIHKYNTSSDNSKDQYRKLLSETLGIISSMKHLYTSDEMGRVILQLQSLFISKSAVTDSGLSKCKPNLAAFVAGLGHIQFEETDNTSKVSASWELFHMLLKERHWALAHLAMTAFGYFSARTSCNELWRFVPPDAALSFDLESGVDVNDERFMSEFKVFFEKEVASVKTTPRSNELALLVKEGLLLKQMAHKMMTIDSDAMEIDDTAQTNKKRKFPDGIGEGVSLLQNGLRIIASGLSLWQQNQLDYSDLHGEFLTRFSNLEDAVGQMAATISQTKPADAPKTGAPNITFARSLDESSSNASTKLKYSVSCLCLATLLALSERPFNGNPSKSNDIHIAGRR